MNKLFQSKRDIIILKYLLKLIGLRVAMLAGFLTSSLKFKIKSGVIDGFLLNTRALTNKLNCIDKHFILFFIKYLQKGKHVLKENMNNLGFGVSMLTFMEIIPLLLIFTGICVFMNGIVGKPLILITQLIKRIKLNG